jgi:NhaP-type Na+/H+ or K+/H+ antiporter
MEIGILVILFCVFVYALLAKRLSSTVITAPMVFLALGFGISQTDILPVEDSSEVLYLVAEIALVVLLFLDASQINVNHLRKHNSWSLRMLLIGLPLSVAIGTLVGLLFFPAWSIALIGLTAAIMAPTDAALSQAVIIDKSVPENERQTLSVESGLNDGLALPIILFFASFLAMKESDSVSYMDWLLLGASQVLIGVFAGVVLGWIGGKLLLLDESRKLSSDVFEGISILALIGITYIVASHFGGNGFIASFIAGLIFGHIVQGEGRFIYRFTESEVQMLVWAAFIVIGLGLLPQAIEDLTLPVTGYILVSLFFVRPVAIFISLVGTKAKMKTRFFLGWFGPRGLATALFALLVSHEVLPEYSHSILVVAVNAVWMSTLLHGFSAAFLARLYAKAISH